MPHTYSFFFIDLLFSVLSLQLCARHRRLGRDALGGSTIFVLVLLVPTRASCFHIDPLFRTPPFQRSALGALVHMPTMLSAFGDCLRGPRRRKNVELSLHLVVARVLRHPRVCPVLLPL